MSKTRKYILCGAAVLLLAGCTAERPDDGRTGTLVPIGVSVGDNGGAVTRASIEVQEVQFQEGETFRVRFADGSAVDDNGEPLAGTLFTTTDDNGTAAPAEGSAQPFFNPSMSSATLQAYYPESVDETTTYFEVSDDQRDDGAYKASDLMYATTTAQKKGTQVTIPLQFEHRMAKVTVLAVAVDSVKTIRNIRIVGGYRSVNLTEAATPGTTLNKALDKDHPLLMYSNDSGGESTVFTAAVLPPQTVEGDFLQFDTDKGTYTYPIRKTTLEGGHAYTLALRVGAERGSDESGGDSGSSSGVTHRITVMAIKNQTYNGGQPVIPVQGIKVLDEEGEELSEDKEGQPGDYKVIYSNNINVGRAQAIVVGIKEYAGCVATAYFNIVPATGSFHFDMDHDEVTYWPKATYVRNTLTVVGDGTPTFSTTDTDVVTVNAKTGEVKLVAPGTATITAKVKDGKNYQYTSQTATYTLTVLPRTEMEPTSDVTDWTNGGGNADGTVDF